MKKYKAIGTLILVGILSVVLSNSSVSATTFKYYTGNSSITKALNKAKFTVSETATQGVATTYCSETGTKQVYVQVKHYDAYKNPFYSVETRDVQIGNMYTATARTNIISKDFLDSVGGYHIADTTSGRTTGYTSTK